MIEDVAHPIPLFGSRTKVLLAEDDDDLRWVLRQVLELDGFQVEDVADGEELLDRIANTLAYDSSPPMPDVVVTDLRMPGFNALTLVETLRYDGWLVPVIVITAFGDPETEERIAALGRARMFHKPLNIDALECAIREATLPLRTSNPKA